MGMLGQMGDMYRLQRQAKQIKKDLALIHISAEEGGVKVTVNASQELVSIEFLDPAILSPDNKTKLEKAIVKAHNRANEKAQKVAAEKMRVMMGDMGGLPGGGAGPQ